MITKDDKTSLQIIIRDLKTFNPETVSNIRFIELVLHVSKLAEIILKLDDKSNAES